MKWTVERNGESLESWNQSLPQIIVSLNNRYMSTMGTSPAMAMFGFNLLFGFNLFVWHDSQGEDELEEVASN